MDRKLLLSKQINSNCKNMIPMINTLVLFMLFLSRQASAYVKNENVKMSILHAEIIEMDSLLFNIAFNQCDAAVFRKIITEDVEFYDDRYGLNISRGDKIKSLIGTKTRSQKVTRKLNSCSISQLGDFGALQTGEHTFYTDEIPQGTGKFIHIWERKGSEWKLKRVISYEHQSFQK